MDVPTYKNQLILKRLDQFCTTLGPIISSHVITRFLLLFIDVCFPSAGLWLGRVFRCQRLFFFFQRVRLKVAVSPTRCVKVAIIKYHQMRNYNNALLIKKNSSISTPLPIARRSNLLHSNTYVLNNIYMYIYISSCRRKNIENFSLSSVFLLIILTAPSIYLLIVTTHLPKFL